MYWKIIIIYSFCYVKVCSFYSYFLERFYHKWMLNFVKGFLCIYWDNHMVFIFQFVNVVYRTVFWLCGRGRGWDDLGEWHWNMYNIIYEMSRQSRFDAQYWMLRAGALGWPRGMVRGGRREAGSGWGTRVYLWQIHVDIWQNQYNIVKLKNKIKIKK